jgi:FAD binding domain
VPTAASFHSSLTRTRTSDHQKTKHQIGVAAASEQYPQLTQWRTSPSRYFSSIDKSSGSSRSSVVYDNNIKKKKIDRLLVVGSGVAGSATALVAAETYQIPVTLLFAGNIAHDCNSNWAQGGIIYRNFDPTSGDSADSLARDIRRAGAGLCVEDAVQKVSQEGPDRVRELLLNPNGPFADVPFDKKPNGELSLCLGR